MVDTEATVAVTAGTVVATEATEATVVATLTEATVATLAEDMAEAMAEALGVALRTVRLARLARRTEVARSPKLGKYYIRENVLIFQATLSIRSSCHWSSLLQRLRLRTMRSPLDRFSRRLTLDNDLACVAQFCTIPPRLTHCFVK